MARPPKVEQYRREALQEKLQGAHCINEIHGILNRVRDDPPTDTVSIRMTRVRLNGLLRMLGKLLPDVRAVGTKAMARYPFVEPTPFIRLSSKLHNGTGDLS
jgi:hypothetical protein